MAAAAVVLRPQRRRLDHRPNGDATSADGTYAYFGPETKPGILTLNIRRSGFCHDSPGTTARVTIGPVALNEQRAPVVEHAQYRKTFHVADCSNNVIRVKARPPVAAQVHVTPLTLGTDYGVPDNRLFGVQLDAQVHALTALVAAPDACARSARRRASARACDA